MSVDDSRVNLALASLLLASDRYPGVDLRGWMGTLDELARGAERSVPTGLGAEAALGGLALYLHGERGFDGAPTAYDSVAGCYLHEALQRRTGLPITLSAIYLEVGWRLRLPLVGVGMPGHYIIAHDGPEPVYCDPFHAGRLLTAGGCRELLREQFGDDLPFRPEHLAPTGRKETLYRMLNNLKGMYLRAREPELALWAADRMLIIQPDSPRDVRDRGLLRYVTGDYARAASDFIACLHMGPQPGDAAVVARHLRAAQQRAGLLN